MKLPFLITLCLLYSAIHTSNAISCEFTMGYRTNERLPLIEKSPNNAGLYKDLYKAAATKIGCSLKVIRAPKKRIMKMLATGEIDFYPGLGYSKERAKSIHFFENGLVSQSVILTRRDHSDITSYEDLKSAVLIRAHGANQKDFGEHLNIATRYVHDLSIGQAISAIEQKKADFFIYNSYALRFHLKRHPSERIRLHKCCGENMAMLVGFSKNSPYSKKRKGQTAKMDEFKQALVEISKSGELAHLFNNYY